MEVGHKPGEFHQNIDIGQGVTFLEQSNSLMTFSPSVDRIDKQIASSLNDVKEKKKNQIFIISDDKEALELSSNQENDSGISDSPRTPPEPLQQDTFNLADFSSNLNQGNDKETAQLVKQDSSNPPINDNKDSVLSVKSELKPPESGRTTDLDEVQNFEGSQKRDPALNTRR